MQSELDGIAEKIGVDLNKFMQPDTMRLIRNPFCDTWTDVCSHRDVPNPQPAIFACFADPRIEAKILEGTDWMKHSNDFAPGFCQSGDETIYITGQEDGFDYIVTEQYFHSIEKNQFIVNPSFIMLFELYKNADENYYSVDECGNLEKVIDIKRETVRVRTKYLMRYIAARQLLYVQFVDGRVSSPGNYPMDAELIHTEEEHANTYSYDMYFQSTPRHDYLFSMVYARSIVRPDSIESSGLWPFDEITSEEYPDFIIGENPDGSYRRFTCDPSKLGTYFGANPEAPHYLTPIFFKSDVLDKYRKNPYFRVTERCLECGTQWEVEIDNVIPERVMVYLGDLGRDLPESERMHFIQYELSPEEQKVSKEAFCNDFLNMFVDSTGPVASFTSARAHLDATWKERFGAPLFRSLHPDENDMPKLIRIPSGNGREEFDTVINNLTKICIDYIDESNLNDTRAAKGSINKLCAFLASNKIPFNPTPLRDLQAIRSESMAHAKGKQYEKLKGSLITDDKPADIARILGRLTEMMHALEHSLSGSKDCSSAVPEE